MEVKLGVELPLHTFEIPVPDIPSRPISSESSHAREAPAGMLDSTPQEFASDAGIFHGSKLSISWKVLDNHSAIELGPLELDARRLPGSGARIRFVSPFPVIPNCVAISEADEYFVVDFITSIGTLTSALVPHSWMLAPDESYPKLPQLTTSRPYSFDLVAPKLMKAVNAKLLVLSLVDGSFIRLDRSSPLGTPVHLTLSDTATSAGGLARFFKASKDKVPGHPSLSVNSAVCLEIINETFAVTYSVNNTVRVWSLISNSCVQTIEPGYASPLRLHPSNYIASRGSEVGISFPHEIRMFDASESTEPLKENISTRADLPVDLRSWFCTSFCLLESGSRLLAFKQNISAKIFLINGNSWTQVGGYDHSRSLDLPTNASIDALKLRILDLPSSIVKLALSQLAHEASVPLTDKELNEQPTSAILEKLTSKDSSDLHTEWLRLDTLSRELDVQASELLAVEPALSTSNGMFFWALRVSRVSLLSVNTLGNTLDAVSGDEGEEEALNIAQMLLSTVPSDTFSQISTQLLSSSLVMDRMDAVCDLLRQHLDQLKLNEVGRTIRSGVAPAIRKYISNYGITDASAKDETAGQLPASLTQLSELGHSAVSSLVYDYSVTQASRFLALASLSVIAFVEGWLADGNDSDLLSTSVACLRRFTIIGELGLHNLHLGISDVPLETFGIPLARRIISSADMISLLSKLLPPFSTPASQSAQEYTDFDRVSEYCEVSAELNLLRCFASLARGEESSGVTLAQQISLSRAWPSVYGERPATQAAWFARVAKYAESVGARNAALWLSQYGESLSSPKEDGSIDLLEHLFKLAIESGDISVAYTALTRRFSNPDLWKTHEVESWIKELISAAARKSVDDARTLIVSYPFIGFSTSLQRTLANNISFATVPAYKLRYAWHVEREDFVGAAQVIYNHLKGDGGIEPVRKAELYAVCLNSLSLADSSSQWLAFRDRIVTLDDVKLEQKSLLDVMASEI